MSKHDGNVEYRNMPGGQIYSNTLWKAIICKLTGLIVIFRIQTYFLRKTGNKTDENLRNLIHSLHA